MIVYPIMNSFKFIPLMLEKYRNDSRIFLIIGTNFLGEWRPKKHSYFFSLFAHTWGWATWKRAWKQYDFELNNWGKLTENYRDIKNKVYKIRNVQRYLW